MSDKDRERKRENMRNYYYKRKIFLNYLINCIEQLENVSFKK